MAKQRPTSLSESRERARHQLRNVLVILGLLDLSVVVSVVVLAVASPRLGLSTENLLLLILGVLGGILSVRVWLGVRLRRRSGSLT